MSTNQVELPDALEQLGYPSLRPMQQEVVDPMLEGKNVLAILPTSAGKSLLFQLPAIMRKGPVVVLSPLVALMNDQVDRCRRVGIDAHALHSHCSPSEKRKVVDGIAAGTVKILYLSPERMQSLDRDFFGEHPPQLFAVDEAHCISEWGHDFRPAYYRMGRTMQRFGDVQRLVLTATATPSVVDEIHRILDLGAAAKRIVYSPDRPNIRYAMAGDRVPVTRMIQHVELPALVYGGTRRIVEEAAKELRAAGYRAAHYHAGMEKTERTRVQDAFRDGEYDVIAATCAFGMGIDHPGIRAVIHLEMPTSLEAYVQESGRAGRDGKQSIALCKATVDTLDTALSMSLMTWPEPATVESFRRRFLKLFEQNRGRWEGEDRLQLTSKEIANTLNRPEMEVGSCIRILDEYGLVHRTPWQERTARVVLLRDKVVKLKSDKEVQIIHRLASEADSDGVIEGTITFFSDVIGMNKEMAGRLSLRGAIRYEWVDRCQIITIGDKGPDDIDNDKLIRMRARCIKRIRACRSYVSCKGCRRKFLLEWFGAEAEGPPLGVCCDRCPK